MSNYAINNSMKSVRNYLKVGNYIDLKFKDNEFDFVLALGVVYALNLADGIKLGKASAVLAASIFHYGKFSIKEAKEYLSKQNIPIRA